MRSKINALLFSLKDESGVAKILVALSIIVLLGFTALVIDVGAIYFEKSRLQKALDAAVLGGAHRLLVSEEEAKTTAISLALKNGYDVVDDSKEMSTGNYFIEIEKKVNKEMTFARVLGVNSTDINAVARAELLYSALVQKGGIVPIGLEDGKYDLSHGNEFALNLDNANKINGNHGFLSLDGRGEDSWEDAVKYGSKSVFAIKDQIYPEPGNLGGNVYNAFNYRIKLDENNPDKTYCNNFETADNSCSRVVLVPIVSEFPNGRSDKVEIRHFAAFWLSGFEGKHNNIVKGVFMNYVTSGTFDDKGTKTNIYRVKLTK
ncbi:Tad domain-containing protein [Sporosarcina sp. ACRSL]|uniref:Tad domain-containing protein n=1 Tax=Sporosarcina sp. ACRSL TaxID=2918215 RepID=UPI001EF3EC4F|nr:Tad domain-containing protein [Sporosarcina sp. ACRSL]MCG7344137.1 Tad domain-containing protein [Sporosarcina sp. ACRSL]